MLGAVALQKHTRVSVFQILKAKSEIPEHKSGKNNISMYFFFHETMF